MYCVLMVWIGSLFGLGIPLASFFMRLVFSLLGGYKVPIAWILSYYSALGLVFVSVFTFFNFKRFEANWRSKAGIASFFTLLSIGLGFVVGLAASKAGVLGHSWEDPLRGSSSTAQDAIISAVTGAIAGLGLALGSVARVKSLTDTGMQFSLALRRCLLTAAMSVGLAFSIALLL